MNVADFAPSGVNAAVLICQLLPVAGWAGPDFWRSGSGLADDCGAGGVAGERCARNPGIAAGAVEFFAGPDDLRWTSCGAHRGESGVAIGVLGEGDAVWGDPRDCGGR